MLSDKLFISGALHERRIELGDGTLETLHFRELTTTEFERFGLWNSSADEEVQARAAARLIAMSLRTADGKEAITAEQAEQLKRPVSVRIVAAIYEVNGLGRRKDGSAQDSKAEAGKESPPGETSGSGTLSA